jgi:predicted aspartyl protease
MSVFGARRIDSTMLSSIPNLTVRARRARYFRILLSLLTIVSIPVFAAAKDVRPIQLGGYKAVPVRYGSLNKMMLSVAINGHPANLIVDTGANQIILDASSAESFGVSPSRYGLRYVGFTQINGQLFPVGFVRTLTAGSMNFGSSSVALLNSSARSSFSNRFENGNLRVDGVLGADILIRHKAVINCRTKFIFFKVDRSRPSQVASFALSEKFTKVPLRQEENGAFTVPSSIHGQTGRLLVDTGAFITTFNEAVVRSLGIALQPTPASARFTNGVARQVSIGQINDLTVGDFKVPAAKFGVAVLPKFALEQGNTRINGILGIDLLFNCHGIVDFDSMNLFLK